MLLSPLLLLGPPQPCAQQPGNRWVLLVAQHNVAREDITFVHRSVAWRDGKVGRLYIAVNVAQPVHPRQSVQQVLPYRRSGAYIPPPITGAGLALVRHVLPKQLSTTQTAQSDGKDEARKIVGIISGHAV